MTVTTFRYGNPARECGAALLRSHCRQLATVVTITGGVDDVNVHAIGDYARHFVLTEKPFVLDLSAVTSFTAQGLSMLDILAADCDAAGVPWRLITGEAVRQVLAEFGDLTTYATAESVPEALTEFSEISHSRLRLLPLLTKTA